MVEADNCDSNLFAFWSLERIKPVADECPELEGAKGHESYFVFADYMIWSWGYAINLDANSSDAGEVILIGGRRPQQVARSFFDFIGLYVQDSKDLYASA